MIDVAARKESLLRQWHTREFIEIVDERPDGAIEACEMGIGGFNDIVFVWRVGAAAMAESEVARGKPERLAGEDIPRIGTGISRPKDRVEPAAFVDGELRLDHGCIGGCISWVISTARLYLDVSKSMLGQMGLERLNCAGIGHVRHKPKVELGQRPVWKHGLAARTGVPGHESFYIYRGCEQQPLQIPAPWQVARPSIYGIDFLEGGLIDSCCSFIQHGLLRVRWGAHAGSKTFNGRVAIRRNQSCQRLNEMKRRAVQNCTKTGMHVLFGPTA